MKTSTHETSLWLPRPVHDVFSFFSDAGNLQAITPAWLSFHILTPRPIPMHPGALIEYRLRIRGFPLRWQTRITAWEPPHRFVDEQLRGPYRVWIHEHLFRERDGGTEILDRIRYRAPFAWITHPLFIKRDVQKIFEFRQMRLKVLFQ